MFSKEACFDFDSEASWFVGQKCFFSKGNYPEETKEGGIFAYLPPCVKQTKSIMIEKSSSSCYYPDSLGYDIGIKQVSTSVSLNFLHDFFSILFF